MAEAVLQSRQHSDMNAVEAIWYIIQSQTDAVRKIIYERLTQSEKEAENIRQQKMVKESLSRAFDEISEAKRTGKKLKTFDEFISEIQN